MSNEPRDDARANEEEVRLGRKLKEAREFLGLSQEAVAVALGIPRPTISAAEGGKRKVTGVELQRFAALYRRDLDYFFRLEPEPEDGIVAALFRATKDLDDQDRQQVLRFAEFLKHAGAAPRVGDA